jgi:hypothetical protein
MMIKTPKPPKSNWQSKVKVAIAASLLSGTIFLEATGHLQKGTAIAITPVVVTIVNSSKQSANKKDSE